MAEVRVAHHAGFCFGVKRATDVAEKMAREKNPENGRIYTLGRLIHNDGYVAELRSKGVGELSQDDIPDICSRAEKGERITVIIRAHGEIHDNLEVLKACAKKTGNLTVLDCTCPYVNKVRKIARENSGEGKLFILIGAKEHPEVRGIISCCRGDSAVFDSAEAIEEWISSGNAPDPAEIEVSVAAQTTQKLSEWKKCLEIIKKLYTNAKIFDTICNVTEERQTEVKELADTSDAVIVIGSRGSSNTVKLFEICKKRCENTFLCENAESLRELVIPKCNTISIAAGASTPFSVIQEVKTMIEQKEN
ncbi:MAG: 4-hydroxy-3-methylbut-2-enyl diphosphate reductase, partial [Ruminococcaceae bacterium]|nr:4-hydroxy-3-methylbut-2-enyl diphosphate reductase [Oscillospiraceae bacterium]